MTNSILLVDDDPISVRSVALMLGDVGQIHFAMNGLDALRMAHQQVPDLILLDQNLPDQSGYSVCKKLKADVLLRDIPVIFITSDNEQAAEEKSFEVGAVDFITKPVNPVLLNARVKTQLRLKKMTDELKRLSNVDALTEIANRRRFDEGLRYEWLRQQRTGEPLSMLLVDIDYFKQYNDDHGHLAGDGCLREVAQALTKASLRPCDLIARYGGEEFALLLPDTNQEGAAHVARRILNVIQNLKIPHASSKVSEFLSVSVGVSCCQELAGFEKAANQDVEQFSARELVAAADEALYAAKDKGRNNYVFLPLHGKQEKKRLAS